jgi:hypothetical protein
LDKVTEVNALGLLGVAAVVALERLGGYICIDPVDIERCKESASIKITPDKFGKWYDIRVEYEVAENTATTPSQVEELAKAMWVFEGDNTPTWEQCVATNAGVVSQYRTLAEFVLQRLGKLTAPARHNPNDGRDYGDESDHCKHS